MSPNEYQTRALATALPKSANLTYMVLGLCNESGEVAGKLKKVMRGDGKLKDRLGAIGDELGDTLWYLVGAIHHCGFTLEQIMDRNIQKLEDRKARGKIQGNGDTR